MGYIATLRGLVGTRPLIMPGSSVVVVDGLGRILLVRRTDTGDWGVPGGFMEPGESFLDTAHREVREEVGLGLSDVELLDVLSGSEHYHRFAHGDEVYNVTAVYAAKPAGEARPDHVEVEEAIYRSIDDLPKRIFGPDRLVIDLFRRLRRKRR